MSLHVGAGKGPGHLNRLPAGLGSASAPVPAVVPLVFTAGGDSWTLGNEQQQSRLGTGNFTATDRWTNQLATLFSTTEYTSPTQTGVTNGIIQAGYGGQNSATIYTNLAAIISGDATRMPNVWSFWGGRNDIGSDAGIANTTNNQTNFINLITHERKMLFLPSFGSGPSPTFADWVRGQEVKKFDWRTYRRYTFNHWQYWWGISPNGDYPGNGAPALASATGSSITTTTMTLGVVTAGTFAIGQNVFGTGVSPNTRITAGAGLSWTVSPSQTVALTTINTSLDPSDTYNMALPHSLSKSAAVAQDHPNYWAAPYMAAMFQPLIAALWNTAVYKLPETIPDVQYDMAAGTTIETYAKGYITGCSISTDDAVSPGMFTASIKGGTTDTVLLTRTSATNGHGGTTISDPLNYKITVTGVDTTGATKTHTNDVRILPSVIGSAVTAAVGTAFPTDTTNPAVFEAFPRLVGRSTTFTSAGGQFSFVMCLKPGSNNEAYTIFSMAGAQNSVLIQRQVGAANHLTFAVKDTAGTNIINWATTVGALSSGVETIIYFSVDTTVPTAKTFIQVGATVTDVSTGMTAAVAGNGLVDLGNAGNAPTFFAPKATSASSFKGGVKMAWMGQTFFDFSNSANRALFASQTTGALVDLGASGSTGTGYSPQVYMRGAPGDWVMGKNHGSATDFNAVDLWLMGTQVSDPTVYV